MTLSVIAGHCADPQAWEDFQGRYANVSREQLAGGKESDFEVAFKTAMLGRSDFDFEPRLAVARDRIRWLSIQLAKANTRLAELGEEV